MVNDNIDTWFKNFLHRKNELRILKNTYNKVKSTSEPSFLLINAERGIGKTRLIREFYSLLRSEEDTYNYWPEELSGDLISLGLNPDYSSFGIDKNLINKVLPYLWWASRFSQQNIRNSSTSLNCEIINAMPSLILHLSILSYSELLSSDRKASLDLLIDTILEVAPKTLFDSTPVGVIKTLMMKAKEANEIRKLKKQINESQIDPESIIKHEIINNTKKLVDGLNAIQDSKNLKKINNNTPILILLDDIQWIDEYSVNIVKELLVEGKNKKIPIYIIATVWPSSWKEAAISDSTSPLSLLRPFLLSEQGLSINFSELNLKKIPDISLILKSAFPGLTNNQKKIIRNICGNDLYALGRLIEDFIERKRLFVNKNVNNAMTERGVEEIQAFKHPRLELEQRRFEKLTEEVQDILGLSSYYGLSFIEQFIIEVTASIGIPTDGVKQAYREAENPLHFITRESSDIVRFSEHVSYQVARRYLDEIPDDIIKIRGISFTVLLKWLKNHSFSNLSLMELGPFVSMVSDILEDNKLCSENKENEDVKWIEHILPLLSEIVQTKKTGQNSINKNLTLDNINKFQPYLDDLHVSLRVLWAERYLNLNDRQVIEKLKTYFLSILFEISSNLISKNELNDISLLIKSVNYITYAHVRLKNDPSIRDKNWFGKDELDYEYYNEQREEYIKSSSSQLINQLKEYLGQLNSCNNSHGFLIRACFFKNFSTICYFNSNKSEKYLDELASIFLSVPSESITKEENLELLFYNGLSDVLFGWPHSNRRDKSFEIAKHFFSSLNQLNPAEASMYQLIVVAKVYQLISVYDQSVKSTDSLQLSYDSIFELINRGFAREVLNWFSFSELISNRMGLFGHDSIKTGTKLPENYENIALERGWNITQGVILKLKNSVRNNDINDIEELFLKAISPMIYRTQDFKGVAGYNECIKKIIYITKGKIDNIEEIANYIWSRNFYQKSLNAPRKRWSLLESAYRVIFSVSFYYTRNEKDSSIHNKIFDELINNFSNSDRAGSVFRLTVDVALNCLKVYSKDQTEQNKYLTQTALFNVVMSQEHLKAVELLCSKEFVQSVMQFSISLYNNNLENIFSSYENECHKLYECINFNKS